MRSATLFVVGSGSMATCFSARSQRKPSEMPVSRNSSGSGGPMLSISARVRIVVWDMRVSLFFLVGRVGPVGPGFLSPYADSAVRGHNERGAGGISLRGTADALIKISETSQCDRVVGIDLSRRFVVADRILFAREAFHHLCHV